MNRFVLTGFETVRSFTQYSSIEDVFSGKEQEFKPGKATISLVFNDGAVKVPCDLSTFNQIKTLCRGSRPKSTAPSTASIHPLRVRPRNTEIGSSPEGVETFGGDLPPVPKDTNDDNPEESWSGVEDEGEDGIGQV